MIQTTNKGGDNLRKTLSRRLPWLPMGFFLLLQTSWGQDITTALAGHWNFDETSGSAADQSGSGNNMTVNLCARAPGTTGNGLSIGPSSNASVAISSLGAIGDFSVFFAIKYQSIDAAALDTLISFTTSPMFMIRREAGPANFTGFFYSSASWEPRVSSAVTPSTNTWYKILVTRSNATLSIYIDGLLKATSTRTNALISPTTLAASSGGTSSFILDDLRLYKRALSSNDLSSLISPVPFASVTNLTNNAKGFPGFTFRGTNAVPLVGLASFRVLISNLSGGTPWGLPVAQDSQTTWSVAPAFPAPGSYDVSLALTNSGTGGLSYMSPPTRITVVSPVKLTVKVVSPLGAPVPGARVLLTANAPSDSGLRVANATGEVVYTNMMTGTALALTNFAPRLVGSPEMATNWVVAETDDTLVWAVPTLAAETPTPTARPYYWAGSAGEFVVGVPPNGYTTITVTGLGGGRRFSLFEGFTTGSTVRLDKNLFRGIPGGMLILETKSSRVGEDDHQSTFTRQMLFLIR